MNLSPGPLGDVVEDRRDGPASRQVARRRGMSLRVVSKRKRTRASVQLAMGLAAALPAGCSHGSVETTPVAARERRRSPAAVATVPPVVEVPVPPSCSDEGPLARLRAAAVDRATYATPILYSWTTADQADELRRGGPLLVRETSPTHGTSVFDAVLERLAAGGDPVAAVLRGPRFRRARFAWKTPWPTLLGWEGEAYGDRLLRVTLRDEAYVLRVTSAAASFEAVDLRGAPVPLAAVLAHPERIGAVHFVNDVREARGTYVVTRAVGASGRFREFVLPNESMIASWELDTPEVRAALDEASALATSMRAWVRDGCYRSASPRPPAGSPWDAPSDFDSPLVAWSRASAFTNDRALPTGPNLTALIDALRAVPRGDPFVGTPSRVTRPAPPAPGPAARPARPRGTFAGTYRKP